MQFKDIEPIYFSLMLNFAIAFVLCYICRKTIIKEWDFGMQFQEIWSGLKKYGMSALAATLIIGISFCIGLTPFDNRPTIWRVLIEGIVYYIGVAIMEKSRQYAEIVI